MNGRVKFFKRAAVLGAGLSGLGETLRAGTPVNGFQSPRGNESGRHSSPFVTQGPKAAPANAVVHNRALPMLTPDVTDLPHVMDGGVKVLHMSAEHVKRVIDP